MSTIPATELVSTTPSVLGVGGSAVDATGLMLSNGTRAPIGTVQTFGSAAAVSAYFGSSSVEARKAAIYFQGFVGSNKLPSTLLVAQYNQSAVAAYLRGGVFPLTLAQMQALSGSLTCVVDGYTHVISSISLAAYNSFSAAAAAIQAAFTDPSISSFTGAIGATFTGTGSGTNLTTSAVTGLISVGDTITGTGVPASTRIVSQTSGTPGGAGVYVTNNSTTSSGNALVASSNVLNVTVNSDNLIAVGQTLTGTSITAGTLITAKGTGTGGVGTYTISGSPQQIASEAMTGVSTAPLVTYDSISSSFVITSGITGAPSTIAFATGTLSASLCLTSATGGVLSQGAAAAVPAAFMNALVQVNSAWVNFMTTFDPDSSGNTVKQAFAAWKNTQGNLYGYVCADYDVTPTLSVPASSSLGQILAANGDSGTCLIWEDVDRDVDAFILGAAASIDFTQTAGRITFAYKAQAGLVASVTTASVALNLGGNPQDPVITDRGNYYNFYGAYAQGNSSFTWFQRGFVSGTYNWFDSYVNQIVMNATFRNALLSLLQNAKSVPYTAAGNSLIEQALAPAIAQFLNFGAFAPGSISASQIVAVNTAAGANIANALQTQGYYLQILPASSTSRAARTTPPCTFWYLDRGSVQAINLASVALQ